MHPIPMEEERRFVVGGGMRRVKVLVWSGLIRTARTVRGRLD